MSNNVVSIGGKASPSSVLLELLKHPDGIDGMVVACQTTKGEIIARFCNIDERTAAYFVSLLSFSIYEHMEIEIVEGE